MLSEINKRQKFARMLASYLSDECGIKRIAHTQVTMFVNASLSPCGDVHNGTPQVMDLLEKHRSISSACRATIGLNTSPNHGGKVLQFAVY